mgnify:CR=1 FL=1
MSPRSQVKNNKSEVFSQERAVSPLPKLNDLLKHGVKGKRVLLRVDINVPMEHGKVSDATRIRKIVPTINALAEKGARVIVLSHFGRPKKEYNPDLSLAPIADALSKELGGKEVKFAVDCIGLAAKDSVKNLNDGEVLLLENLRFHEGEEKNDPDFTRQLADLGDYFVNDAFSCSHRAHSSIVGLAEKLPAYAGLLLDEELSALEKILEKPKKPFAAIVGGAKISSKVDLLQNLVQKVDVLIIGGGMANTFLYAQGINVEKSLCEKDCKKVVDEIFKLAEKNNCQIILPTDAVVADKLEEFAECKVVDINSVPSGNMILDIGPRTILEVANAISECQSLVWNGPLGAFEFRPFDVGTISLSRIVANQTANGDLVSVAGGGDILSALHKAGLRNSFTYISTAGGAFLEWLEGKELPGIKILRKK